MLYIFKYLRDYKRLLVTREYIFHIGKLIRDKVPDIERELGISPYERIMEMGEYRERLRHKLIEEANEVLEASSNEEFLVELADLTEVIHALAATADFTSQDIEEARIAKKLKRGGFEGRIFNSHTVVKHDHPELSFFRANAHKYPEIKLKLK